MGTKSTRSDGSAPAGTETARGACKHRASAEHTPRVFRRLDEAARYAETHDVGEAGPPAELPDLPEPARGTLRLRVDAELLRRLRAEALRRGARDLNEVAVALLADRLGYAAQDLSGTRSR